MPNKMSLGQYIPGDSIVHRLDPRVKIFLVILYMVSLFYIRDLVVFIPIAVFYLIIARVAKLKIKHIIKALKPLILIIIITAILNILVTPGKEVFKIWKIVVTEEGLLRSALMAIRLVFLIAGTSILTLTTSTILLTDGLESILSPLKIIKFPAHELAMMISIALRFIPTLFEEADKIRKAQMARGADFDTGNLIQKAKSMIPLLVPLFLSSFRRADELAVAMVSRCYRGSEGRTRLNPLKLEAKDIVILIVVTMFLFCVIFSEKLLAFVR